MQAALGAKTIIQEATQFENSFKALLSDKFEKLVDAQGKEAKQEYAKNIFHCLTMLDNCYKEFLNHFLEDAENSSLRVKKFYQDNQAFNSHMMLAMYHNEKALGRISMQQFMLINFKTKEKILKEEHNNKRLTPPGPAKIHPGELRELAECDRTVSTLFKN